MWFRDLTGFDETSPDEVRRQLSQSGNRLHSRVNGKSWICGRLEVITLGELRGRCELITSGSSLKLDEVVSDAQTLHKDPSNAGALFQVASQFNLLEMVGPSISPEAGVGIYENDRTQGPACAIAAGAGTIYRNYFVPVNGHLGQSSSNQIDCLEEIGSLLDNTDHRHWKMQNGYALASAAGLKTIATRLEAMSEPQQDEVRRRLKVGIQWDVQVTLAGCTHLVTQVYCSAMPVAYSGHSYDAWKPFAALILEAAYEATLCAGRLNAQQTGNRTVFLTQLGGGAFGNESTWILQAIERACRLHQHSGLSVKMISYGAPDPMLQRLCN